MSALTDVILPLEAWETLVSLFEELEDRAVVRERWAVRETRAAWPTLDQVEGELAADGLLEGIGILVTVRLSKRDEFVLPEPLGRSLGLSEGDRVEVRRQDGILWLRRSGSSQPPGPLTELAGIVSSSLPVGSVDVEKVLTLRERP